jgi:hypothetical protein
VDSCPPCRVPLAVNAEYTLSASLPSRHRAPVVSMYALSWLDGLPNRVGVPNSTASAHRRSSRVASTTSAVSSTCWLQAGLVLIAAGGASSTTLRSRTSAPAFSAPSAMACARVCTLPVAL